MKPILIAEKITKTFMNKESVLSGINLEIEEDIFVAILGPSGSGKTTLLNVMSGLLRPSSGHVLFNGEDITGMSERKLADWKRNHVGNIFQSYMLLNNLTARENIQIGINSNGTPLPFDRLTRILEIESILDKFPSQLSGGQQQRVAIARAIIKKPSILFCDEATGALDEANSKRVVSLLHDVKSTFGISVLFVTHNHQIAETAERIITIKDGLIFQDRLNHTPILPDDMVWG